MFWPKTKIKKSQGNAFDWRNFSQPKPMAVSRRSEISSAAATKYVNDKRKQGVDISHVPGMNSVGARDPKRYAT